MLLILLAAAVPAAAQRGERANLAASDERVLERAIARGDLALLDALLRRGADPNARPRDREAPLIVALDHGNVEAVHLLLRYDADPNARGRDGRAPLVRAMQQARQGDRAGRAAVSLLLRAGADPNLIYEGWTALHTAIGAGDLALASELLRAGADPNHPAPDGTPPLHLAAERGEAMIAYVLLRAGADPRARHAGRTALDVADGHRTAEILQAAGVPTTRTAVEERRDGRRPHAPRPRHKRRGR